MATATLKHGPPSFIAAIVEALTPRRFRTALAARLIANYTTLPQYCRDAAQGIRLTLAVNSREAFNPRRHAGDVLAVFIGFSTSDASIGALSAILAVTITTLLWRDAQTHPVEPSPEEAATDAFVLGAAIVLSQALLFTATASL